MKTLKITKIIIDNFMGFKHLTVDFDGKDTTLLAVNGVGKTTVLSAITWSLFGYDISGSNKFDIKPNDITGTAENYISVSVEGHYLLDGEPLVIKRVLEEKWSRIGGEANKEMSGHITKYYINDMTTALDKEKDFNKEMEKIATPEQFKLLTDPLFFSLSKKFGETKKRELVVKVAGADFDDKVVAGVNEDFTEIVNLKKDKSIFDYIKTLKGQRTELSNDLDELGAIIKDRKKNMKEKPEVTLAALNKALKENQDILSGNQVKHSGLLAGDGLGAAQNELESIVNGIKIEELAIKVETSEKTGLCVEAINKHDKDIKIYGGFAIESNAEVAHLKEDILTQKIKFDGLRGAFIKIEAEICPDESGKCSLCDKPFSVEEMESINNTAKASFKKDKTRRIEILKADGRECNFKIKKHNEEISQAFNNFNIGNEKKEAAQLKKKEAEKDLKTIKDTPATSKTLATLLSEKEAKEKEISNIKTGDNSTQLMSVNNAINENNEKIREVQAKIAIYGEIKGDVDRIKSATKEKKEKGVAHEELSRLIYGAECLDRAKCRMIEEAVNDMFKPATFKLFRDQLNGGYKPCCDVFINNGRFGSGLNLGHSILAGMAIIDRLQKHFGIILPLFLDREESLTVPIHSEAQLIRARVPDMAQLETSIFELEELKREAIEEGERDVFSPSIDIFKEKLERFKNGELIIERTD